jgi:His/Glu/Gln/Arg/opine family amino acid ABC transporter permease subunit
MEHCTMNLVLYTPLLIKGALITICAWLIAGTVSFFIGTFMGIASCNHLKNPRWLMRCIRIYTFIAKGVPAYVQILIAYFVIPAALGIQIPGMFAAIAALAFCSSGYVTEIVRAGINTIPHGQWDACFVLGYPLRATITRIIMPQTFKNIVPALCGELEQLLKSTSLLATIGITELTRTGMNIISRELNPTPVYLTIACIYLLFSAVLQYIMRSIEKKDTYGNH